MLNIHKLLKPGGHLIYSTFEHLPLNEAYENLDKTKWGKYNHSNFISAFWKRQDPLEDFRKLTQRIGFKEIIITSQDGILRLPDLDTARGTFFVRS